MINVIPYYLHSTDGISSKNSRGLFLQMHNISSADLLWDKKKCRKRKANVSSDYYAVERLISRWTSRGTVSSQFALVYDVCHQFSYMLKFYN